MVAMGSVSALKSAAKVPYVDVVLLLTKVNAAVLCVNEGIYMRCA